MVSGQLLKKAFNKYHDEDDLLQLGLLFMLHLVILGIDPSVKVNDFYLHLADNLTMFNEYARESLSFEHTRGALLFAPKSTNDDGDDSDNNYDAKSIANGGSDYGSDEDEG